MSEHDDYDRATGDHGPIDPHRTRLLRYVEPVHPLRGVSWLGVSFVIVFLVLATVVGFSAAP